MYKLLSAKEKKLKVNSELQEMLGKLKHAHTMRNLDLAELWNDKDPVFPGEMPTITKATDFP
jgi:hypothetical protein